MAWYMLLYFLSIATAGPQRSLIDVECMHVCTERPQRFYLETIFK